MTNYILRYALVRASYKGLNVSPTTEFVELFLRNVILGEQNELRNRDMLIGATLPSSIQSVIRENSKSKICTLDCTLEEIAVLHCIETNPKITQKEMAKSIGKSERTVKTITSSLVEKGVITRRNGRRNGWWEILIFYRKG